MMREKAKPSLDGEMGDGLPHLNIWLAVKLCSNKKIQQRQLNPAPSLLQDADSALQGQQAVKHAPVVLASKSQNVL